MTSFTGCRRTYQGLGAFSGEAQAYFGQIRDPQNVHEEIMNLVYIEQYTSRQTVLTTSTEEAYVDFDFGIEFCGIHIPENKVSINWEQHREGEELSYFFSWREGEDRNYIHYIYNRDSKILYGDEELSYLIDNFLVDYFTWCELSANYFGKFSLDNLGDFTYKYEYPIYNRELSDSNSQNTVEETTTAHYSAE